jgi:hypothetical protein
MTTATALTINRDVIERFIVEVDALATFDEINHGASQTWLNEHIYKMLDEFERAFGLRPMSDDAAERLHGRGIERGREVWQEFVQAMERDHAR